MSDSGFALGCPIPFNDYDRVLQAHGGVETITNCSILKRNPLGSPWNELLIFVNLNP